MLNYFENLRKKPEAERKRKVFVISLTLTLIIAAIWAVSLFIYKKGVPAIKESATSNIPSLSETFSTFGQQIQKIFQNSDTYESAPSGETVK